MCCQFPYKNSPIWSHWSLTNLGFVSKRWRGEHFPVELERLESQVRTSSELGHLARWNINNNVIDNIATTIATSQTEENGKGTCNGDHLHPTHTHTLVSRYTVTHLLSWFLLFYAVRSSLKYFSKIVLTWERSLWLQPAKSPPHRGRLAFLKVGHPSIDRSRLDEYSTNIYNVITRGSVQITVFQTEFFCINQRVFLTEFLFLLWRQPMTTP